MRYPVCLVSAVCVIALAVVGCGSSSSSPTSSAAAPANATGTAATTTTTHLAKTKFVLHAGLAFGAFHHWIYKPAKAGELTHPLEHKFTTVKAALAAAFVYHELKLALADAQASPTLSKLVSPITDLDNKLHGLASSVKSGGANPGDVDGIDSTISQVKSQAAAAGQPITEQTPATPSG
ncbi:MAG TPA: hypothetical protein VMB27_00655 [Solirubrobacteraceae bacterium]|nr:hypothetical protein [Solirubrobacteraceae bacterium]